MCFWFGFEFRFEIWSLCLSWVWFRFGFLIWGFGLVFGLDLEFCVRFVSGI